MESIRHLLKMLWTLNRLELKDNILRIFMSVIPTIGKNFLIGKGDMPWMT